MNPAQAPAASPAPAPAVQAQFTFDSSVGEFELTTGEIGTLLGNNTHGLPAGKYAVAKMISDNATPTVPGDDTPVWELQSVIWDPTADSGNGDFVPNQALNAPTPVTISGLPVMVKQLLL